MSPNKSAQSKIWVSHPTGNANVRAVVDTFERNQMLDTFHTCIGVGSDSTNMLTNRLFGQRRCPIPSLKIKIMPARETLRLLLQKRNWLPGLRRHESGPLCIDQVYQTLDARVARRLKAATNLPDALYAYEDGALQSFLAARERDLTCIYDLPIGYWRTARRIQSEEAELHPQWACTMHALKDSELKLARKDSELQAADAIFVASQFTANSLKDAPFELPAPTIIPYGCPEVRLDHAPEPSGSDTLKVLYVGGLSQRKGLSYLLDAVEQLGNAVELTIIGKRVADCAPLDAALKRYRWIESLPHEGILEVMRAHDVFVFPSLFEGFGLVLTEALSQGIPIISTAHTCAPDIIEDGKEGFIVPIRDADAIAAKLSLLHADRDRLQTMKEAALNTARSTTWAAYKNGLAEAAQQILEDAQ